VPKVELQSAQKIVGKHSERTAAEATPPALQLPIVKMAMVVSRKEVDYSIKPEAVTPAVDTSTWPLLLKNYDKRV
jgi:hypothetical protein